MTQHLEYRAINPLLIGRKYSHGDISHMRHRGIGDQLFHILLRQGDQ